MLFKVETLHQNVRILNHLLIIGRLNYLTLLSDWMNGPRDTLRTYRHADSMLYSEISVFLYLYVCFVVLLLSIPVQVDRKP